MKKPLPFLICFGLSFIFGCSTGTVNKVDLHHKSNQFVKNYTIQFDKLIPTSLSASGTLRIKKIGDHVILYDGHVSAFKLVCVQYSTGKEIWAAPEGVRGLYFKDGELVAQFHDHIEIYEIASGKSVWKLNDCIISYNYPEGGELGDIISVTHQGRNSTLDLKTREIIRNAGPVLLATLFKIGENGEVSKTSKDVKNTFSLGEEFILADVIEKSGGEQEIYLWSLKEDTRLYTLRILDSKYNLLKEHSWTIPANTYTEAHDRAFNGLPEPEKLSPSSYLIKDQLILFENYTSYRWSWGRGTNRITSIDIKTREIKYQVWGQAPGDNDFYTFHFFNHMVMLSNGIMHFQDEPSVYKKFDLETGKALDTIQRRFTLFLEYLPQVLLGFTYERKQIKEMEYTNKVSITAWNNITNEYSKTFDFDFKEEYPYDPVIGEDGTILFSYYDKVTKKSILYCCRVIPASN